MPTWAVGVVGLAIIFFQQAFRLVPHAFRYHFKIQQVGFGSSYILPDCNGPLGLVYIRACTLDRCDGRRVWVWCDYES